MTMTENTMRIIASIVPPFGAFAKYWLSVHFGGDPYNGTDLLWAGLVTTILMVGWYLFFPLRKKVERLSIAWMLAVNFGILLMVIGYIFGVEMQYHWGDYVWFYGLWSTGLSFVFGKDHKPHKISIPQEPKANQARKRLGEIQQITANPQRYGTR